MLLTMRRSDFKSLLVREDLPTFGRPVKHILMRRLSFCSMVSDSSISGSGPRSSLIFSRRASAWRPCSAETVRVSLKPRR